MRLLLAATLAVPYVILPQATLAQEAEIEEITVTAARREQSLQTLATSATVFNGEALEELGVLQPRDLAEQTPGLLTKFGPNGLATVGFYMRAVGINDFTGTVDPSVGIYVDEVFKPTPDMLNFAVFDIERVEVLRGPQGTLYGRNSTGGAINFITAKPTETFEGFVRAEAGSYETAAVTGAVSGPLGENLAGRFSFRGQYSGSDSGYSFNRFTNNELGKDNSIALRGQLHWTPNDTVDVRLTYGYGDQSSEQPLLQHVAARDPANPLAVCQPVVNGRRAEGPCVDLLGYFDPDDDEYDGDANLDPELDIESHELTARVEWMLPRFSIISITGFDDFSKEQSQDIDASPNVAADNFTFSEVDNFSQELRLTSDDSWPVEWIAGVNYARTDVDWFQTIDLSDLAGIPTSNGADQETRAWAVFGHLTLPLSDRFELVGGVRYTNEQRDWSGATFIGTFTDLASAFASGAPTLSVLPLPAGDPRQGGPLDFDNSLDENNFDYQAILKYTPSDTSMFYIGTSEAFRSGGFSSAVLFSQEALEPYQPEDLRAYEAGMKLSLLDRRLRLDASAFFYDFEGFQATFVRATEASARLQNAGDVESYGLEAQLNWLATERLDLTLGVSLLETEIVDTAVVLPPLDGGPESTIRGNEIPNAPGYSVNGRVRYQMPTGNGFVTRLQGDFNLVDDHFLEPNNRQVLAEDGYLVVNARAGFGPEDGRWEVAAWVKNLADTDYRSAAQDLALALGFSEIVLGRPRTWGLQFEYRF